MSEARRSSAAERVVYAISAVVVAATCGLAIALDLAGPETERPVIEVHLDGETWEEADRLAIPWVVENRGSWNVQDVQVEARAGDGEPVLHHVDYLARGARHHGVSLVPLGPDAPELRIVGYHLP